MKCNDIIDLFMEIKMSPGVKNNILPVLIEYNKYVSFEAKCRLKESKENIFKLVEVKHPTIFGTQIDGEYQIMDIADENYYICRMYSEIPRLIGGNEYYAINNILLPIDFLTYEFKNDGRCVYWNYQNLDEFEAEFKYSSKLGYYDLLTQESIIL